MEGSVHVADTDGQSLVSLTRHPPSHGEETLGVTLSMDGSNKDAIYSLWGKMDKVASSVRSPQHLPLSRGGVVHA